MSDCLSGAVQCGKYELCNKVTLRCTPCNHVWCSEFGIRINGQELCKKKCFDYWQDFIRSTTTSSSSTTGSLMLRATTAYHTTDDVVLRNGLIISVAVLLMVLVGILVFYGFKHWKKNKGHNEKRHNDTEDDTLEEILMEKMPVQPEIPNGQPEQSGPDQDPEKHKMLRPHEENPNEAANNMPYPGMERQTASVNAA